MKKIKNTLLLVLIMVLAVSCFEDRDDNITLNSNFLEINDFVWKGMNAFYVYKAEIPNLANDRFSSNEEYTEYLNSFDRPEDLFGSLLYLPETIDEFSGITSDYIALEQQLQGTRETNGMRFEIRPLENGDIFGYVRYVLPNSDADIKGVTRGMVFSGIDGIDFNDASSISALLDNTTYTINLATYNNNGTSDIFDDTLTPLNTEITLTKSVITENPILVNDVIETSGFKIGYLMYNGFRFEDGPVTELNNAFGNFSSENIDELVLDLRYNGGGSVSTAIWLASLITGQFDGQVFFEEEWNSDIQTLLETDNPDALVNNFVSSATKRDSDNNIIFNLPLNSLNLNKVYVLTSPSTASASELVINGLRPYIDVVQIGTSTRGKPQASRILYDSDNFSRSNVNPNHTYATLPLIYESANADGFSQYYDGLAPNPNFILTEDYGNLGVLGNQDEPLLQRAIMDITGSGRFTPINNLINPPKAIFNDYNVVNQNMFDDGNR